ncbi:hypothetical protein Ahy_B07g088273 isoform D [Arachis hypogaea]|uniref:Uncharacterized protein n=1 Tax=Arachis hypogaea TaxID=3818 RepID=A0A444YE44_ARAHY|nr:hypothetical protein Ahy_B07g088273 isoform D [Arachis hypogaea]
MRTAESERNRPVRLNRNLTVSLHHRRRKEWDTSSVRRTQELPPSSCRRVPSLRPLFALADRSFFLEVSSASVVLVCLAALPSPSVALKSFRPRLVFVLESPTPLLVCSSSVLRLVAVVWSPSCSPLSGHRRAQSLSVILYPDCSDRRCLNQ